MSIWIFIKFLHILAGVFWIGAAVVVTFFIIPAVRAAGAAGGAVMKQLTNRRKLPLSINAAAAATTLSGILLYWYLAGFNVVFSSSLWWMGLMTGSLSGIAAFLWGFLVQSRNAKRLGILTAQVQNPPTPEQAAAITKLQRKLYRGGITGTILLVISLTGMVLTHPM